MLNERSDPNSIVGLWPGDPLFIRRIVDEFYRGGFGPVRLYTTVARFNRI